MQRKPFNLLSRVATTSAWLALLAATAGAHAQGFALEGAIIDSRSARSLGVISERGDINALFRAQKSMTFGILRSAGISLDQLSPEVRARIERFATTNVDAFRAFSQGLDLKDQGKFVEAKAEFARAAQLDPGFALASEQQQAMPDVNLGTSVQTRAVVLAAAGAAVDRGKASFVIDTARALAAIAAGQSVAVVTVPSNAEPAKTIDYSTNPPGSGAQFIPNRAVALSYTLALPPTGTPFSLALAAEWKSDSFVVNGPVLESLGKLGGFQAQRGGADNVPGGETVLADGTKAYWGAWKTAPGASTGASITVLTPTGQPIPPAALGPVNYAMADATRTMPTSGTAVFAPIGGSLEAASGNIAVDFVNRNVELRNLGFKIEGFTFSGLNGRANYSAAIASGSFGGVYSSGVCTGCPGLVLGSSRFDGSFVGRNADGMVFSTFMVTGPSTSAAGVHLLGKQP